MHLEALRGRENDLWTDANRFIVTKRPRNYDQAIAILQDLRELAEKDGRLRRFTSACSLCAETTPATCVVGEVTKGKAARSTIDDALLFTTLDTLRRNQPSSPLRRQRSMTIATLSATADLASKRSR